MTRVFAILLALCIPLMMSVNIASADSGPSVNAIGKPGAKGTFVFKPSDWTGEGTNTWWKDTDGVSPGVAGCHIGTDEKGEPNGRSFGEACMENGLLVESNPKTNVVHKHSDDIGHPDMFDCNAWCVGSGKASGSCVAVKLKDSPCATSAKCECK